MKHEKLKFTKTSARQAVKKLIANNLSHEERMKCLQLLANFRSAHGYPMESMIGHIRKKAFEIDKNAIIVTRLKRIPSIVSKLKRITSMQVSTMGDIGGIRVIVKNKDQAIKLANSLEKSKTRNNLVRKDDYITSPKASGYRSIHLTYSYQGKKLNYRDLRVEIQIRSLVQHSWATAVEVVGTFSGQNLKAGDGSKEWLDFFKATSKALVYFEEKLPLPEEFRSKIIDLRTSLKVVETLLSYSIIAKESDKIEGYYLLKLDLQQKTILVKHNSTSFLFDAYEEYRRIEQEIAEDQTQDVVLVSASSLKDLKKAYPNYFADTLKFLDNINKALEFNIPK